ncbi:hypothetical protein U1Q18_014152 [Sarracenia purpurea var. burkii]
MLKSQAQSHAKSQVTAPSPSQEQNIVVPTPNPTHIEANPHFDPPGSSSVDPPASAEAPSSTTSKEGED